MVTETCEETSQACADNAAEALSQEFRDAANTEAETCCGGSCGCSDPIPNAQNDTPDPMPPMSEFDQLIYKTQVQLSIPFCDLILLMQGLNLLTPYYIQRLEEIIFDPNLPLVQRLQAIKFVKETVVRTADIKRQVGETLKPLTIKAKELLAQETEAMTPEQRDVMERQKALIGEFATHGGF